MLAPRLVLASQCANVLSLLPPQKAVPRSVAQSEQVGGVAVVFGKLAYAQWHSWPQREQNAVNQFFAAYWQHQLADPIVGAFEDAVDTVLCVLSNACASVQPYLETWIQTDMANARRHLAAFILNDSSLLKKGRLSNAFWDTAGTPHDAVVDWVQSQAIRD